MKMAKASHADIDMAIELALALEALTNRWSPAMPLAIDQGDQDSSEDFDIDDEDKCRRVLEYLLELANRASLFRVVFGMSVLLDPKNELVDPDADTLETHPKLDEAAKDAERYRWLKGCNSGSIGIRTIEMDEMLARDLVEDEADAAIDAAMAKNAEGARGTTGCACVDRDSVQCAAIRLGMDHYGEACECLCHQWDGDDDGTTSP